MQPMQDSKYAMQLKHPRFFTPIGYLDNGKPVYPIAGGAVDDIPDNLPTNLHTNTSTESEARFTAADIERVRREEKDKVYKRLEQEVQARQALENQFSELAATTKAREEAEAAAAQKVAEEARRKAESELSAKDLLAQREQEFNARIAETTQTWEQKFQQLQQEREQERALLEKDRELANLKAYTQQRVTAENDNIAPQLREFIGGNTPEEIDASIERVKATSLEIATAAQEAFAAARASQRGVSPTGYAPVGPVEIEGSQRQYSAEDIANMDMATYAKFRQNLPGISGSQNMNRGLYG